MNQHRIFEMMHYPQCYKEIKKMLDKEPYLTEEKDSFGRTMIFTAVITNNIPLTELLYCQHNCNLNVKDYQGKTPRDYARIFKHENILQILDNKGLQI